ncbi:MAG: hypothetical protein ABI361_07050 [Nitrososphaera sp.]|jgi:hypothetical protein
MADGNAQTSPARAVSVREEYRRFLRKAKDLFPKVDQKLLLNILQFETEYSDWEGGVLLKVVYPSGTDIDAKKEMFYSRYGWMSSIEEDKTLRMKAIRMYVEEIDRMLDWDSDIIYITGSATLTPAHSYSA